MLELHFVGVGLIELVRR